MSRTGPAPERGLKHGLVSPGRVRSTSSASDVKGISTARIAL
ncbi:hypothetical protein C4K21_2748 [Pseudomonas chlororaphis subsp. aurantiaca]|nr:hypothetical protein C4K21_2748 [Pseudomonas chlororaphis subsp. aurantiaca]AZD60536.1 hypothetical protein C4K18_2563 [Pseudomonas chlororaphis subsp. aurantiaca]